MWVDAALRGADKRPWSSRYAMSILNQQPSPVPTCNVRGKTAARYVATYRYKEV